MFEYCSNLTEFTSDLSALNYSTCMFYGCSNLTSFSSDLSSLTDGEKMFKCCNLDTASIKNIAKTLRFVNKDSEIHIGNVNYWDSDLTESCELMALKGWTVCYNGTVGNHDDSIYECSSNIDDIRNIIIDLT
jgi:hypothetical protein